MSETPFVRSKPVTQQDIAYSKNKIHIKFYKPIIGLNIKSGIGIDSYEPHQGYLSALQNRIVDGIKHPNTYRFISVNDDNMILIEQQERIGQDESGNPIFSEEKKFIKHEYFKPLRMTDYTTISNFKRMFPPYIEKAKEHIRLEYANQIYLIEPMTEFRINIESHYIEERKLINENGIIKPVTEEYKVNNKIKF